MDTYDYDKLQASLDRGATYDGALIEQGLCPNIVPVMTEDGPSDGRCLAPITDIECGACAGHASEQREWLAMSEAEKAAWEFAHDGEGF